MRAPVRRPGSRCSCMSIRSPSTRAAALPAASRRAAHPVGGQHIRLHVRVGAPLAARVALPGRPLAAASCTGGVGWSSGRGSCSDAAPRQAATGVHAVPAEPQHASPHQPRQQPSKGTCLMVGPTSLTGPTSRLMSRSCQRLPPCAGAAGAAMRRGRQQSAGRAGGRAREGQAAMQHLPGCSCWLGPLRPPWRPAPPCDHRGSRPAGHPPVRRAG